LTVEIEIIRTKLKAIPDIKSTTMRAQLLLRQRESMLRTRGHMSKMTFDEKRKLLQIAFAGKDIDGKRYGVYVYKNKKGDWLYIIRGIFQDYNGHIRKINITESVSMKNEEIDEYNQLKYLDYYEKQDMRCKCLAYYGVCLYQR